MVSPAVPDPERWPDREAEGAHDRGPAPGLGAGEQAPTKGRTWLGRRTLAIALGAALGIGFALAEPFPGSVPGRDEGLAAALLGDGLHAAAEDVVWIEGPPGVTAPFGGKARAVVRAAEAEGQAADLYLVETRLSPEGVLLEVGDIYNLTETTGADERNVTIAGERVAYVARSMIEGAPDVVTVIDLTGHASLPESWSGMQRMQQRITHWQDTGQLAGVRRRVFELESEGPASVSLDGDFLEVNAEGQVARIELARAKETLPDWIRHDDFGLAPPGNLTTWSVDRVRSIPWVGDDTMQYIKYVAFTAKGFVDGYREKITGDTGEEGIAEDLGEEFLGDASRQIPVNPEIGFPPPPLEPWITPALEGEGEWNAKDDPAFHRQNPGLPPTFITTYLRTDKERRATRVYIALWDPRQVELHMIAGRVEPKSATGKAGTGTIPRTPEVMGRLVGASNAGFQALHGEYGMMAEGTVYLPAKPFAATVSKLDDGSNGFGTWPEDPTVPDEIVSYRQNMTVMVQDEEFNPYGRTWWGGTVPGAEDKIHTVRTGICLTREHFIAYFYGADLSPNALARAMIQTRCKYGLALDMNAGHAGLEYYRADPSDTFLPDVPLMSRSDYEGEVPEMDGWMFRRRGLIRGMGLMYPPRYIKREARDFFYMTLRHLVPGDPLPPFAEPAEAGEGEWKVEGLPHHGFPYAMALTRARVGADGPYARIAKLDPRTFRWDEGQPTQVEPSDGTTGMNAAVGSTIALFDPGDPSLAVEDGAVSLWHGPDELFRDVHQPVAGAVRILSGRSKPVDAFGVACIAHPSEMLMVAELEVEEGLETPPEGSASQLQGLLSRLGCTEDDAVFLTEPVGIALGGDTGLDGEAVHPPRSKFVVRLERKEAPGGRRILTDTPIKPIDYWHPLQQHRVRYFKKK